MASINYPKNMVDLLKEINCNTEKQLYCLITIIHYKWLSLILFIYFQSQELKESLLVFLDLTLEKNSLWVNILHAC